MNIIGVFEKNENSLSGQLLADDWLEYNFVLACQTICEKDEIIILNCKEDIKKHANNTSYTFIFNCDFFIKFDEIKDLIYNVVSQKKSACLCDDNDNVIIRSFYGVNESVPEDNYKFKIKAKKITALNYYDIYEKIKKFQHDKFKNAILLGEAINISPFCQIGENTIIKSGVTIKGKTKIGSGCLISGDTLINNSVIGDEVTILKAVVYDSNINSKTTIGPFAYIRPNCLIGSKVKIGDFVEVKNATIGDGTKISHLTYVGDCDVGKNVNFGCGTVIVNYDGINKARSIIEDNAFIGCNSNLVSPVKIGMNAYTAAGSTITQDVPPDSLAIARQRQTVLDDWISPKRKTIKKKEEKK